MAFSMSLSEISMEVDTNYLKTCAEHLAAIGNALKVYEKEHGDFPECLSELHPKYLSDTDALICPADEDQGNPILPYNTKLTGFVLFFHFANPLKTDMCLHLLSVFGEPPTPFHKHFFKC